MLNQKHRSLYYIVGIVVLIAYFTVQTNTYAGGLWSTISSTGTPRSYHTVVTLLPDGRLLVTGGVDNKRNILASTELFYAMGNSWASGAAMGSPPAFHTATLMNNGKVLITGGANATGALATAELYNPGTDKWQVAKSMLVARAEQVATLLPSGKVLKRELQQEQAGSTALSATVINEAS